MSIDDCLQLAVKVLNKTMDSTAPAADKMELTKIQRIDGKVRSNLYDDNTLAHILPDSSDLSKRALRVLICLLSVSLGR